MVNDLPDLEYLVLNCCRVSVRSIATLVRSLRKLRYFRVKTHTLGKSVAEEELADYLGSGLQCRWYWKEQSGVGCTKPMLNLLVYPVGVRDGFEVIEDTFERVFSVRVLV